MIYAYGITQQGTYHIKNDLVCQDAHKIIKCNDSYAIAAVADGLGSEEHSDIASKMAVEISTEYCAKNIKDDYSKSQILEVIKDSFAKAQFQIEQTAIANGHELDQYDTTLSIAVFIKNTLYYGQSGDSGIVALTADGLYKKVVEQQRDDEGRVFPLYFGEEKWEFGMFPEQVVSVFLATDGMFETLFPVYIQKEPVSIYVALARYFMGPDSLHIEEVGEKSVKEKIEQFMLSIPDAQVNDDKTVAVLIDPDFEYKTQSADYYEEPNWNELKRKYEDEWRRAAYPHLFNGTTTESEQPTNQDLASPGTVSDISKLPLIDDEDGADVCTCEVDEETLPKEENCDSGDLENTDRPSNNKMQPTDAGKKKSAFRKLFSK